MKVLNSFSDDRDFNRKFLIVLGVHFFVFILSYSLDFSSWFSHDLDPETTKMLKSSVRVDVVGMPKYTFKELQELERAFADKQGDTEEIKDHKPDQINENDIALEKASKVDLKKLLGNYGGKKVRNKKNKKKSKIKIKDLNSLILEGNKISSGSSLVGDNSQELQTAFEEYVSALPDLVRKHWRLPSYLKEQDLNCRIRVYLDSQGRVIRKVVATSSGSDEFDNKALHAIDLASPFPEPDKAILRKLVKGDVYLGFPL